jgi:hypothetical protein
VTLDHAFETVLAQGVSATRASGWLDESPTKSTL